MVVTKTMGRFLAVIMVFLTTFIGLVSTSAQAAAATTNSQNSTTLTLDQSDEDQAVDSKDYEGFSDSENALKAGNSLLAYYLEYGKTNGPEWLKTTDFQFNWTEDNKPVYSFDTIQPFSGLANKGRVCFWQGSYAYNSDDGSTANLGLGWRLLSPSKSSIIGLNMFYDYGFQYNLARIGFGTEYFNKLNEYRFNLYYPVSGEREIDSSSALFIRAVDGFDYEAGTALKNALWAKFYLGGFYWDNKYNPIEQGWQAQTSMQLTPRINLEIGYYNSNLNHEPYVYLTYNLANAAGPSAWGGNHAKDTCNDISYKLLQKVQRASEIQTETYQKTTANSVYIDITNSMSSTRYYKLQVNGTELTSFSLTAGGSKTIISNLSAGTTVYIYIYSDAAYNNELGYTSIPITDTSSTYTFSDTL